VTQHLKKLFTHNLFYTWEHFTNHCAIATKKALLVFHALDNDILALEKEVFATHLQDTLPQSLAICESGHD